MTTFFAIVLLYLAVGVVLTLGAWINDSLRGDRWTLREIASHRRMVFAVVLRWPWFLWVVVSEKGGSR